MKRLLILLAATALSTPAVAQHGGHNMPGHTMPMPKAKPKAAPKPALRKPAAKAKPKPAAKAKPAARAKPAAKAKPKAVAKPAPKRAAPKPAAKQPAPTANPHAGHQMPQVTDPHAGHQMPPPAAPVAGSVAPQSADPHAGHQMAPALPLPVDPHAGHDMGAAAASPQAPPLAPPPPEAFLGPKHAADLVYGDERMAEAREELYDEHGDIETYKILIDQLEARIGKGRDGYAWDGQAWYGGDIDKVWLKTEGEGSFGRAVEKAEVQALWSHAINPWFDLQTGIRYDFRPDPERAYLVLGVQGLAPYWFEIDAATFVSNKGDVSARFEAEYDLRLTQKLILQPRLEFDLALQDVPEIGVGSGLSSGELGARLRYEIRPTFAPYVGVEYEQAFGDTADFRRAEGEQAGGWNVLVGLRTWF